MITKWLLAFQSTKSLEMVSTHMDLIEASVAYKAATDEFLKVVESLSESQLDVSANGEWTPRQIIHHVADSEAQSYARLRRLIAEPGTEIQSYDEGGWGENETLGYKILPIERSLEVFKSVRSSSLEIVKRLSVEQLDNFGFHSESGQYTVATWLETYIKHPVEHAEQIRSRLSHDNLT